MSKEKSDQNAVAELTREGLYKENKWLGEENEKLKEDYKVLGILNDEIRRVNENLGEENKKLREELSAYDREFRDEDKKANNIYKSQKENIFWGKIC